MGDRERVGSDRYTMSRFSARGGDAPGGARSARLGRIAAIVSLLTGALHLAVANRYDVFRDELYFIVCGRHPQFGYLDQPPLVPLLAAAGYALGAQTWILRLPAVLAAAALPWLAVAFVRLLGGRARAAWLAGVACAVAPMFLGLTATLNTTSFELVAWTGVAYGLTRAIVRDEPRALLWTGLGAGIAFEAKYALALWLATLGVGLLATRERALLGRASLWVAAAIAVAIASPSVAWQAAHGFPFLELIHNAGRKDVAVAPVAFAINQILVLDPLLAPLWLAGLVGPFVVPSLARVRFVAIAACATIVAVVAAHGKDYYLAAIYPSLFVFGAVTVERAVRGRIAIGAYLAASVAVSAVIAPVALPILSPPVLARYLVTMHLAPQAQEKGIAGAALPQLFADMLGWRAFAREVGTAYDSLPPETRARTSILVQNYGEAAALDVYGAPYHLPPALAGQNQYGLWATRGQHPRDLLRVQDHVERLRPYCRSVRVISYTNAPFALAYENGNAIAYCAGLHPSLESLWPDIRFVI